MRRSIISVVAIAGKETRQVLRQPRLIGALILGPFAILGLFAAGFQADPAPLRTLVVADEGSLFADRSGDIGEVLGDAIDLVGVTADGDVARARLAAGEVDVVVIAPEDADDTIRSGDHATVMVLHDRLDPFDRTYIAVSSDAAVGELNRAVLRELTRAVQDRSGSILDALPAAREAAARLIDALESGDQGSVDQAAEAVSAEVEALDVRWIDAAQLVGGIEAGSGAGARPLDTMELEGLVAGEPASMERAREIEADLAELEQWGIELGEIPADVLTQPFVADTRLLSTADIPLTSYYTPAVIVVLLQHVILTFAAMSIVRERELGVAELFRVGPVRPAEVVFGKFVGYSVIGVVVAALLAVAIVFGLGTPMAGSWWWLAGVLGLTMVASLSLGFVIAAAATSGTQAVQLSMLVLLFTIFFSVLVVSLDRLVVGVRQIALLAPATSGTTALHDVMLRGRPPSPASLAVLGVVSVGSLTVALIWLERQEVA